MTVPQNVEDAFSFVYQHAIPDPEGELADEYGTVTDEDTEHFEKAMHTVLEYLIAQKSQP